MRMLGDIQRQTLAQIARQTPEVVERGEGESLDTMLDLRGKAKSYSGHYVRSVAHAVGAHNRHLCATDCPVPESLEIVAGPVGPRGGQGYYVIPR